MTSNLFTPERLPRGAEWISDGSETYTFAISPAHAASPTILVGLRVRRAPAWSDAEGAVHRRPPEVLIGLVERLFEGALTDHAERARECAAKLATMGRLQAVVESSGGRAVVGPFVDLVRPSPQRIIIGTSGGTVRHGAETVVPADHAAATLAAAWRNGSIRIPKNLPNRSTLDGAMRAFGGNLVDPITKTVALAIWHGADPSRQGSVVRMRGLY